MPGSQQSNISAQTEAQVCKKHTKEREGFEEKKTAFLVEENSAVLKVGVFVGF